MDIEQLTVLLEAARAAGEGALSVVYVHYGFKVLVLLSWIGFLSGVFIAGARFIARQQCVGRIERAVAARINTYAPLTHPEVDRAVDWIETAQKAELRKTYRIQRLEAEVARLRTALQEARQGGER